MNITFHEVQFVHILIKYFFLTRKNTFGSSVENYNFSAKFVVAVAHCNTTQCLT